MLIAPERFVRVGAPLLEELMQSPSFVSTACHSFTSNGQTKRMRSDNSHHTRDNDDNNNNNNNNDNNNGDVKKARNECDDSCQTYMNVDATL